MDFTAPLTLRILDAAEAIVIGDGVEALGYGMIAERVGISHSDAREAYPVFEQIIASVLTRMTSSLARVVVDNVERDPRGGLPSRIYGYALSAIYETPLARALYFADPAGLSRMMRAVDGVVPVPELSVHPQLLPALQKAGMARADVDAASITAVINAIGSGVSMTAPGQRLDEISKGLVMMLERSVDADVRDTRPGKDLVYLHAELIIAQSSA